MRAAALALLVAATPLAAQEFPGDKGPPYKLKTLDLVYTVQSFGSVVQDLTVRETNTELHVELAADVLFDFDKATLLPKAEATLKKAAEFVQSHNKGATVRVEGHTDSKGSDAYNQSLSLRRADSVKAWLTKHGLSGMKFTTEGFGAKKPVVPNQKPDGSDHPEGRQKNRRVEIVIHK